MLLIITFFLRDQYDTNVCQICKISRKENQNVYKMDSQYRFQHWYIFPLTIKLSANEHKLCLLTIGSIFVVTPGFCLQLHVLSIMFQNFKRGSAYNILDTSKQFFVFIERDMTNIIRDIKHFAISLVIRRVL